MADDDTPGAPGPWTVKGIPQEDRAAINSAAKRADQTVGEWLRSAAALKIHHERQGPALPAQAEDLGRPEAYHPAGSVAVVVQLTAVLPSLTTEARGGGPLATLTRKVITQHLRALMLEPGPPAGHTAKRLAGPT